MSELFHLHPMAVHFPIALLTLGLAVALWDWRGKSMNGPTEAVTWLLWLGTASAWATLGLGFLAERTAPHVPVAWETLADHEQLAWVTCGIFTALSALCLAARQWPRIANRSAGLLVAGWFIGVLALMATARQGGHLVYEHGMGVVDREH